MDPSNFFGSEERSLNFKVFEKQKDFDVMLGIFFLFYFISNDARNLKVSDVG